MMKRMICILILISLASGSGVPMRPGDQLQHSDIQYDYDVRENAYHGNGGILCDECNTTVEDYVISQEGRIYCLDCWDVFFFNESLEC